MKAGDSEAHIIETYISIGPSKEDEERRRRILNHIVENTGVKEENISFWGETANAPIDTEEEFYQWFPDISGKLFVAEVSWRYASQQFARVLFWAKQAGAGAAKIYFTANDLFTLAAVPETLKMLRELEHNSPKIVHMRAA